MVAYNFDATDPEELKEVIYALSLRIKDLEDEVAELKQEEVDDHDKLVMLQKR